MKTLILLLAPLLVNCQIYTTPTVPSFIQVYQANYCLSRTIIGDTTLCFTFNPNGADGYIYVAYSSPQNGSLNITQIEQYENNVLIQQGNYIQSTSQELNICFTITNSYVDNFCPYFIPYIGLAVNFGQVQAAQYNDYLVVNWQTMSESNSNYFDVMMSRDLIAWQKIGSKKSFGNTSTQQNYNFNWKVRESGLFYLQIWEHDYNGSITLSNPIYVQLNALKVEVWNYDLAGRRLR
jgi:hypothetical protein